MKEVLPGLYLIDLDQQMSGFRKFISCWIYHKNGTVVLVDPGPASTIDLVMKALSDLNIQKIDHILLTHIHIDHAGGTGLLLKKYPQAKINCHPKGIPHMIDPEKLWQGSLKVLGKVARAYGPIAAVPEASISYQQQIKTAQQTIQVVETPGHASHHVSYLIDDILFLGEAAGVNVPGTGGFYLRPATPPVFIYEIYSDSIVRASEIEASHFCFAHYGYRTDGDLIFKNALKQLELWSEKIKARVFAGGDNFEQELLNEFLNEDPALAGFNELDADIRDRERYFCLNSIYGMKQYYQKILESSPEMMNVK